MQEELKRLESQPLEEGTPPMTKDQRFEAVLGPERSGYICGRGVGLKPKTSTVGQGIHAQLERERMRSLGCKLRRIQGAWSCWKKRIVRWLCEWSPQSPNQPRSRHKCKLRCRQHSSPKQNCERHRCKLRYSPRLTSSSSSSRSQAKFQCDA